MLSPRFAAALNALYGDQGFEFILVQNLVGPKTEDEHWADRFKRFGGEYVLSGDTKIAYKPHQAQAFIDNQFVSVFMQHPWQSVGFHIQIANIVYLWPVVAKKFGERKLGTLWRAPCDSQNGNTSLKVCELEQLIIPERVLDDVRQAKSTSA